MLRGLMALGFIALTGCASKVPLQPGLYPLTYAGLQTSSNVLPNGVIPPEDLVVKTPLPDALEAFSASTYVARHCDGFGVNDEKVFRFYKDYGLLPGDLDKNGKLNADFRWQYDTLNHQAFRGFSGVSCEAGQRLAYRMADNPGWIAR